MFGWAIRIDGAMRGDIARAVIASYVSFRNHMERLYDRSLVQQPSRNPVFRMSFLLSISVLQGHLVCDSVF